MTMEFALVDCLPPGKAGLLIAEFVASSIECAHRSKPDRWGLTVRDGWLRLNVGMPEALALGAELDICVMRNTIPAWMSVHEGVTIHANDENFGGDVFKSVRSSRLLEVDDFRPRELKRILTAIQQSHLQFIGTASTTQRNGMTVKGHTPGGIIELSGLVGRSLPQPGYASAARELATNRG